MNNLPALVIIGPTASGKSDLAIKLAKEKNGEVISVDSRQIYRHMDIGTGKVPRDIDSPQNGYFSEGVLHHLLDIKNPGEEYGVTDFIQDAKAKEAEIRTRGKLPIFCGGTLFWMESYLRDTSFPAVPPNKKLRKELEHKETAKLFSLLEEKDPLRAESIDPHNKIRLIRSLEIINALGAVPERIHTPLREGYEIVTVVPEREVLRERIATRLLKRFEDGMLEEVQALVAAGITHEWLQKIGLEYRYISLFLEGKMSEEEMKEKLFFAIWHYAKRQITFLKRFS